MSLVTALSNFLISGDRPLREALQVMNIEGVSSIVVVDNHFNVIGNISAVDVKVSRLTFADIRG